MCSSLFLLQYGITNWTCKGKRRGRGGEMFCIGTAPPDTLSQSMTTCSKDTLGNTSFNWTRQLVLSSYSKAEHASSMGVLEEEEEGGGQY